MNLYIDKDNLISFVRSNDKSDVLEYAARIRKNLDIQYNFSMNEIQGNEFLTYWFSTLGSGIGGSHNFCPPKQVVPARPMKSNFYNALDAEGHSSLFFLDDESKCSATDAKRCVIVSKVGDELAKLKSVFLPDEKGEILSYQITDWASFLPQLPLSDIIICDNHYFKNKIVYDVNDNEILRALCSIPNQSPVNVVIIVKEGEIDSGIDLNVEKEKIKDLVKGLSGSIKSTVTILTTYSTHDRALITNYYRVKQGSSFHLRENSLKHDVSSEIKTHAIRKNHDFTKALLAEYQRIASNPSNCIGDRISNYLTF